MNAKAVSALKIASFRETPDNSIVMSLAEVIMSIGAWHCNKS